MPDADRLPHALYRADQVRHLDRCAIEQHAIPGLTLMNRAGEVAYRALRERWPGARSLVVLTGVGNNGGDGYVVARLAQADGLTVRVLQLGDAGRIKGDAARCLEAWRGQGGALESYEGLPRRADLLVDAILGTGLERLVEGSWAAAIEAINRHPAPCVALDIPSGLHADTGRIMGSAVRAAMTVSFIGLKLGLFVGSGPDCCGEIRYSALSVPAVVFSGEVAAGRRIDWRQQSTRFGPRQRTAHKGTFGHLLLVGGAPGFSGALRLAGEAALRTGAGLVTLATHPAHATCLGVPRPELMVSGVADPQDLHPLIERADVIAIGPGLGRTSWSRALWEPVYASGRPLILDADALNLLAETPGEPPGSGGCDVSDQVLTPHPGEAARLLGVTVARVEADRVGAVQSLQSRYGGVAVLKGAGTLIQGRAERPVAVCSEGNPGMASAGTGDVLTGVIGALRAQGLAPEDAACAGVCLHAAAGDRAARGGERGLIASDLIAALRPVLNGIVESSREDLVGRMPGGRSFGGEGTWN